MPTDPTDVTTDDEDEEEGERAGIPNEIDSDEEEEEDFIPAGLGDEEDEEEPELKKRIKRMRGAPEAERSMQEQPFQNFSVIIMNILSSTQPKQHVKLYHFIKILAKRLNETDVVNKLDSLYKGVNVLGANRKIYKIPLSVLQYVYDRDSMLGYSPTKSYQKRQITLAGILIALDGVMEILIDYYLQLCDEHNIPLESPSQPPNFSGVDVDDLPSMEG